MIDIRQCFTCGCIIHYRNFILGSHNKVQREHFTSEMIKEIWDNPIFVLKCCKCFYGNESYIEQIERLAKIVKKMKGRIIMI